MVTHLVVSRTKRDFVEFPVVIEEWNHRKDLLLAEYPLQLALISMQTDETFIPHVHLNRHVDIRETRTIESWIVIQGKVEASLYDSSYNVLGKVILYPMDLIITLNGGHNYRSMSDDTLVVEVKSGPYDQENDKIRF